MKKLQLRIDDLQVESFQTAARREVSGTVRGFDSTTGNQIICECTDNGNPCNTNDCGSYGCSYGCPNSQDPTCATGNQIICEC